jgi:hypothetical protein
MTRCFSSIIAPPRQLRKPLVRAPSCPTQVGTPCKRRPKNPSYLTTWTGWQTAVSMCHLPAWTPPEELFCSSYWITRREKRCREIEDAHRGLRPHGGCSKTCPGFQIIFDRTPWQLPSPPIVFSSNHRKKSLISCATMLKMTKWSSGCSN